MRLYEKVAMRLLWNRSQLLLASQYILQGILYGLQTQYLPITLRKTGSSLLSVGYLHLLTFPWLLKSLWAPLVDLYGDSSVWLSLSYAGTAAALLAVTAHDSVIFAFSLVLLNACSASTDLTLGKVILTDFHADEMSKGSSLQIISYKVGVLFGGGLMLMFSEHFSIHREIFPVLAVVYLLLAVTFCVTHAKLRVHRHHSRKISFPNLTRITGFAHAPGIKWIMTCACFYKFASHSSQSLLVMFLVDRGESIFYIGFITGIVGQLISVTVASVCGIVLAAKWMNPVQLFTLTSLLTFCSVLTQLCIVCHGGTTLLFLTLVCVLHNVVHGSQATPVYTLMLRCSQGAPPSLQATVFSFLGTLEIVGKQLSLFLAGVLAEFLGYPVGMAVSLTGSLLIFCLIQVCPQYYTKSL